MAVYDCFPFFNENDLLEIRINQHWDFVDKFIITEAGETHTGKPKPFNFDHERFEQYKSKVIYRTFDNFDTEIAENKTLLDSHSIMDRKKVGQVTEDWIRDHFQGNYPLKILDEISANEDDIIYISALDEMLNHDAFQQGIDRFKDKEILYPIYYQEEWNGPENTPISRPISISSWSGTMQSLRPSFGFVLDIYNYKFNLLCTTNTNVSVGQMTEFSTFDHVHPSTMRSLGLGTHPSIANAGWHFAFMDGTDGNQVLAKLQSWAHSQDYDPETKKPNWGATNVDEALKRLFYNSKISKVDMTTESHPPYLMKNLDRYRNYLDEGWIDNYKKANPSFWSNS